MRYGSAVTGAAPADVIAARRFACAAVGPMAGRSAFARLQLRAYDVGALMATDPILEWSKAIWDGQVPRQQLSLAWRRALPIISMADRPFSAVEGPAGAMLASLLRLGWKSPSPFHFIDKEGGYIDLTDICPDTLRLMLRDALRDQDGKRSAMGARIGGMPDLEPLRDAVGTKAVRGTAVGASLIALGEGGWWTQERLFEAGAHGVEDPYCRACGPGADEEHRSPCWPLVGSLLHRCAACLASRKLRDMASNHKGILEQAQRLDASNDPLFVHGVPLMLPKPAKVPFVARWCGGRDPPQDFAPTGNAFTDGALKQLAPRVARRGGWAWVVIDDQGKVIAGMYGTCPEVHLSSLRVELRAVIQVLRACIPPITVWVDNARVVEGWQRGPEWCTASARPAADLWKVLWWTASDIGEDLISIRKVKGHASEGDVQAGRTTWYKRAGNEQADHFAGQGADLAEELAPAAMHVSHYRRAREWYKWLAVLAANWPRDVQEAVQRPRAIAPAHAAPRQVAAVVDLAAVHAVQPHDVKESSGRLACERCQRYISASAPAFARRLFIGGECRGSVEQRAAKASASRGAVRADGTPTGSGHTLMTTGPITWCYRCGCNSQTYVKGLAEPCKGKAANGHRLTRLNRLKAGRHPADGSTLSAPARPYQLSGATAVMA